MKLYSNNDWSDVLNYAEFDITIKPSGRVLIFAYTGNGVKIWEEEG